MTASIVRCISTERAIFVFIKVLLNLILCILPLKRLSPVTIDDRKDAIIWNKGCKWNAVSSIITRVHNMFNTLFNQFYLLFRFHLISGKVQLHIDLGFSKPIQCVNEILLNFITDLYVNLVPNFGFLVLYCI